MKLQRMVYGVAFVVGLVLCAPRVHAQFGYHNSIILGGGPIMDIGRNYRWPVFSWDDWNRGYMDQTAYPATEGPLSRQTVNAAPGEGADSQAANVYGSGAIPRTSETITARLEKDGRLFIQWSGEPSVVDHITISLLDRDGKVLKERRINQLPAETRFSLTNKTAAYRVVVEYINGMTNTVVSPL